MKLSRHKLNELKGSVLRWQNKLDQGMVCKVVGLKSGEVVEFEGTSLRHSYRTIRRFINEEMGRGGSQWDLEFYHEEYRHSPMCKRRASFEVELESNQTVEPGHGELVAAANIIGTQILEGADLEVSIEDHQTMVDNLLEMHDLGMITINPPD